MSKVSEMNIRWPLDFVWIGFGVISAVGLITTNPPQPWGFLFIQIFMFGALVYAGFKTLAD